MPATIDVSGAVVAVCRIEGDVVAELEFHLEMGVRELMAGGMTEDEARREAHRQFGDLQRTREGLAHRRLTRRRG